MMAEHINVNNENKMVSETLQLSCVTNGEITSILDTQSEQCSFQGFNEIHGRSECELNSSDVDSGEENISGPPERNDADNLNVQMQSKNGRQRREITLQDMSSNQDIFDDEDDDSDWEPLQKQMKTVNWFCTNCTMLNLGDVVHCDICGEHKESGIQKRGFFASPLLQDTDSSEADMEVAQKDKGLSIQKSDSDRLTLVGFDERMLLHSEVEMKSRPHPERPDRLRAIMASLATAGIFPGRCCSIPAREITAEELKKVHSSEHIQAVDVCCHLLSAYFTSDTYANKHSARAARLAAGLCADLTAKIISGSAENGFALVRPPGHHAGVRLAMGFCLHNNAAIAAIAAKAAGAKKVLIVDWDVHHGNGTQEIFDGDNSVLYISLHRHEGGKFYPGTGAADEVGTIGAEGYCVNIPWSRGGIGDNDYIFAFQNVVLPIAYEFAPDFTIISAGFDAARGDPLGCCDVTPAGYAEMTNMLNSLSDGKLLVILEGGYNLRSISSSATAVIKVLLGENLETDLTNCVPSKTGLQTVMDVLKIQMNFWPTLESRFTELKSCWHIYLNESRRKQIRKRRHTVPPLWWRWGRKRWLYHCLVACRNLDHRMAH